MKIRNILAAAVVVVSGCLITEPAFATVNCPKDSRRTTANTLAECNLEEDNSLIPTITNIINVIIGFLGLAAVIVIILGGVQYTTSAGDPGKVKKAKDTILYGIVGLVIALLAFAIVNFVMSSLSGSGGEDDNKEDTGAIVYQIG